MFFERHVADQGRSLEGAQHRFLKASLQESRDSALLQPTNEPRALRALHEIFTQWMRSPVERIESAQGTERGARMQAYQTWLEHLANVPLHSAVDDAEFDQWERSLDEDIACRARLFRAVVGDHPVWTHCLPEYLHAAQEMAHALSMINEVRGLLDRRTCSGAALQDLAKMGIILYGGVLVPRPRHERANEEVSTAKQAWDRGYATRVEMVLASAELVEAFPVRVAALRERVEGHANMYAKMIIPTDILAAIQTISERFLTLDRRLGALLDQRTRAKDHERAAFDRDIALHEQWKEDALRKKEVYVELRDVLEEAVALGLLADIRFPSPILARQLFTRLFSSAP